MGLMFKRNNNTALNNDSKLSHNFSIVIFKRLCFRPLENFHKCCKSAKKLCDFIYFGYTQCIKTLYDCKFESNRIFGGIIELPP